MKVHLQRSAIAALALGVIALLAITFLRSDPTGLSTNAETRERPAETSSGAEPVRTDATTEPEQAVGAASLQANLEITNDVEDDLPDDAPDVITIPDLHNGVLARDIEAPDGAPTPLFEIGWDIKDLRFRYLVESDELVIGLNSYGVIGDPDGNGDPSRFDDRWEMADIRGTDVADLGIGEGVTLGLDLDADGAYDLAVGTHYRSRIQNFGVFEYKDPAPLSPLDQAAYGDPVGQLGIRPMSPALRTPDLVFSIANFSQLPGNDGSLDFGVNVIAGSLSGDVGDDSIGDFDTPIPVRLEASLGDRVWSDDDGDGIQDDGEPGLGGIVVDLFDAVGNPVASAITDETGGYGFDVPPGDYQLAFVALGRDTISPRNAGADRAADSDADPSTGRTSVITLRPGAVEASIDAGIVRFVPTAGIDIESATNGFDADVAPGPLLTAGSAVQYTYAVVNTGNVPLTDVVVTDDGAGGPVSCPATELVVGGSMTCWLDGVVTPGPYRNVGIATGTPSGDGIGLPMAADADVSHHFGASAGIDLEKSTNGEDADEGPGPDLTVGEEAVFSFTITNTGNVELVSIIVDDDVLGPICAIDELAAGASTTCEASAVVSPGEHVNIGTVEALVAYTIGDRTQTVIAQDPSHHRGVEPIQTCEATTPGPRMYHGGIVVDETGLFAAAGSKIRIVTSEPGGSPDQPNEQVYVRIGDDEYGPTPVELGLLEFTVENGGLVTIVHHSVATGDTSRSNSVEYTWCGTDVSRPTVHPCEAPVAGPRLHRYGKTVWTPHLDAAPGSTISVTTSEPGDSPGQPHEQVYVQVGDELFGPTPAEHGSSTYTVAEGGAVTVHHYSVFNDNAYDSNSVEVELCGSMLHPAR